MGFAAKRQTDGDRTAAAYASGAARVLGGTGAAWRRLFLWSRRCASGRQNRRRVACGFLPYTNPPRDRLPDLTGPDDDKYVCHRYLPVSDLRAKTLVLR